MAEDKRQEHLLKISLDKSRVDLSSPIIFLCGGLVDITKNPAPSFRDALLRYLASNRCELEGYMKRAESFKDWINDSIYPDLLAFENDIAQISSLIVLILESPGSLTELGLFIRNETLKNKLLVFVNEKYFSEDSFISLGPIRHLRTINNTNVFSYPWEEDEIEKTLKNCLSDIRTDLKDVVSTMHKTEIFDPKNHGHIAFLIFEIVKTFSALKQHEIERFLSALKITIEAKILRRLLFLLKKFDLIDVLRYGNIDYYHSKSDINKLNFGGSFDPTSAKISSMQYYLNHDEKRFKAIGIIRKKGAH